MPLELHLLIMKFQLLVGVKRMELNSGLAEIPGVNTGEKTDFSDFLEARTIWELNQHALTLFLETPGLKMKEMQQNLLAQINRK
jgi:hypothetical protein